MIRQLDEHSFISAQIDPAEMAAFKAQGVTMIVNNRPDGEDEGQPTSAAIEAAAAAHGIAYRHVPIARGMGPSDVEAMREAIHDAGHHESGGKLLAYCRTGQRSALAWSIARNEDGATRAELESCATRAGISLDPIAHLLRD